MSKVKKKQSNIAAFPPSNDIYNPFQELSQTSFYDRQTKKPPKISKRVGKCFQLMLICQKLLKPFSSSGKESRQMIPKHDVDFKEKTRPVLEINNPCRLTETMAALETLKSDACVQTNTESFPDISRIILDDHCGSNKGSKEDFPGEEEAANNQYWDLDIDSAIVGDFNSMSGLSLDEEIDPHYTTIQVSSDARVIERAIGSVAPVQYAPLYPDEKISCATSNASSPKSGVYSRIMKPRKTIDLDLRVNDYYRRYSSSKLNFETIMAIRTQLGLSRDLGEYCPGSEGSVAATDCNLPTDTPDIPRRTYGSSVVNYITKLRLTDACPTSGRNIAIGFSPSVICLDRQSSSNNIYSPIWLGGRRTSLGLSRILDTPGSEPIIHKRSMNKVIQQLNPIYRDDSSEDASTTSFNSPSRATCSYPRYFSDNLPKKSLLANGHIASVNTLSQDSSRFRHMDSELDLNVVAGDRVVHEHVSCLRGVGDALEGQEVPSKVTAAEVPFLCEEKWSLQPLMERSCEEDYWRESCYHF